MTAIRSPLDNRCVRRTCGKVKIQSVSTQTECPMCLLGDSYRVVSSMCYASRGTAHPWLLNGDAVSIM